MANHIGIFIKYNAIAKTNAAKIILMTVFKREKSGLKSVLNMYK